MYRILSSKTFRSNTVKKVHTQVGTYIAYIPNTGFTVFYVHIYVIICANITKKY